MRPKTEQKNVFRRVVRFAAEVEDLLRLIFFHVQPHDITFVVNQIVSVRHAKLGIVILFPLFQQQIRAMYAGVERLAVVGPVIDEELLVFLIFFFVF